MGEGRSTTAITCVFGIVFVVFSVFVFFFYSLQVCLRWIAQRG